MKKGYDENVDAALQIMMINMAWEFLLHILGYEWEAVFSQGPIYFIEYDVDGSDFLWAVPWPYMLCMNTKE